MPTKSKILIVDDHPIFRKGLGQLINEEKDMKVCGEAENVDDARKAITRLKPDMVTIDITLREKSGLELIKDTADRYPELPTLVLSMHDESLYAERVIRAGARGYIMKQAMTGNVITAIRQVLGGKIYASETMVENLLGKLRVRPSDPFTNPVETLTDRELEVFQLIGKGFERKEIAEMLSVSVKTIGSYRERIKEKLNLKNSAELMKNVFEWMANQAK